MTHLVFLPDRVRPRFLAWGPDGDAARLLPPALRKERADLVDATLARRKVSGVGIDLVDALPGLAALTADDLEACSGSVAAWSMGTKLALDLVARGRLLPRIDTSAGRSVARFGVCLADPEDAERVERLARAFPPAAHAVPVAVPRRAAAEVWDPRTLLEAFLDSVASCLTQTPRRARDRSRDGNGAVSWEHRWADALGAVDATFQAAGFQERTLLEDLERWVEPLANFEREAPRTCLRLELPQESEAQAGDRFSLDVLVHPGNDPSLLVPAAEVFRRRVGIAQRLGVDLQVAEERVLRALALAARVFPPLARVLAGAVPQRMSLTSAEAGSFVTAAAGFLMQMGITVVLPAGLTRSGRQRLRLRMRLADAPRSAGTVGGGPGSISLDEAIDFHWQADLAGQLLSGTDIRELAALKQPLVQFRGQWVVVDPHELAEASRLLAEEGGTMPMYRALATALGGGEAAVADELPVVVEASGATALLLERLRAGPEDAEAVGTPADFHGELRPYQVRGLAWLTRMAELGLGACLADDMGLGKTVQLLAFLLERRRRFADDARPALLICPTSVIGNWEREAARFAPTLPVIRHYGADRTSVGVDAAPLPSCALVITSYGVLRRDVDELHERDWAVVALDEAQNIKNASSRTARAARQLRARHRFALTGTPVENRLSELWSISEFLNPRLLGPFESFRRDFATPIERHGRDDVTDRLARIVQPFLLRRLKSDPTVIADLPPKQEMSVVCSLTREQASLYQAALDDTMQRIESSEGMQRRGLVLALITALKQICNHPAHYLHEARAEPRRSGKLQRLGEMLEEALAEGDRALVFTQFREMGALLVAELERELGREVLFLHGGVARARRDEMVRRFQEDARGPRIFVLSLKAGGTGLNLTAANHVFHFDRWWNPAVEDQATDRAHRIGQRERVQVHKLVSAGTVEEKIERMLGAKRELARRIVGSGERWITELDDVELNELFSLAPAGAVVIDDTEANP